MTKNLSFLVIILIGFVFKSNSHIVYPFKCPKVTTVESFDLDRYMGTWYEYSKYFFAPEVGEKCQQIVYNNEGNGTVAVIYTGVIAGINMPRSVKGTGKVTEPGQLDVSYRHSVFSSMNYLILGTDYDNWAVVYSCENINIFKHIRFLWILTRERFPSKETVAAARKIIGKNNLDYLIMTKTYHGMCPYISNPFENDKENPEASSTSTTSENPAASSASTTSGNPAVSSASTESGYPGASSASSTSGYPEPSSVSTTSGNPAASSASTTSGNPAASSTSTTSGYPGPSTASPTSAYPGASPVPTNSGNPAASSASTTSGYPGASSASINPENPAASSTIPSTEVLTDTSENQETTDFWITSTEGLTDYDETSLGV